MPEVRTAITSGEAVCLRLSTLLDDMISNEAGAAAEDSEYLHNYRVALRRARVVISRFREVLPVEAAAYFSAELRWLGQCSGPLRDCDTHLHALDNYLAWLPETIRPDAEPFRAYLLHKKKFEQAKFLTVLLDPRYILFITYWKAFAAKGHADWNNRAWALFEESCPGKIWRLYRRIVRDGRRITRASPSTDLHELRKTGKKLRYLIELSENIFHNEEAMESSSLLRHLRRLQTILGDHQDYDVQAAAIMEYVQINSGNEQVSKQTCLALGMLIGHLNARQSRVREKFEDSFKMISGRQCKIEFRELCRKTEQSADEVT